MATHLSREKAREVDRLAMDAFGLLGLVLMENAGRGCAEWIVEQQPDGPIVLFCGKGNNGGDGFVIGRHLDAWGFPISLVLCCRPGDLSGDARVNFEIAQKAGLPIQAFDDCRPENLVQTVSRASWCVDALLGTGSRGAPRAPICDAIELINHSAKRVLAIDLPSGLDCDTGLCESPTVRADATCTFVAPKIGFREPSAEEVLGTVRIIDIGLPSRLLEMLEIKP